MYCSEDQVQRRLCLINGLANESKLNKNLPSVVTRLCDQYASCAIYWHLDVDKIEYLLSSHAEFCNHTMQMDSFRFKLALRNEEGSIILEIIPVKEKSQCEDRIYVELYCIETQSQYKTSHLFNTNTVSSGFFRLYDESGRRFPHCKWSNLHLTDTECFNKRRLTFAVYLKILNESECQKPFSSNISYQWNLNTVSSIVSNKYHKIYSSNFGNNSWCLWYTNDSANEELITVGLQLLKLPNNWENGVIFKCIVDYENNTKIIEFMYFLDLLHSHVKLGKIPKSTSWIKTTIHVNTDN
eukprot:537503_1